MTQSYLGQITVPQIPVVNPGGPPIVPSLFTFNFPKQPYQNTNGEWIYGTSSASLLDLNNQYLLTPNATAPTFPDANGMLIASTGLNGVKSTTVEKVGQTIVSIFRFNAPPTGDASTLVDTLTATTANGGQTHYVWGGGSPAAGLYVEMQVTGGAAPAHAIATPTLVENSIYFLAVAQDGIGWEAFCSGADTTGTEVLLPQTGGNTIGFGNCYNNKGYAEVVAPYLLGNLIVPFRMSLAGMKMLYKQEQIKYLQNKSVTIV